MPLLRLLPACLLATACTVSAAAQSPVASLDASKPVSSTFASGTLNAQVPNIQVMPLSKASVALFAAKPATLPVPLNVLAKTRIAVLTARSNAPCYTIRSYGFTARDLQSSTPSPSSSSTCTPATTLALKDAGAVVLIGK